MMISKRNETFSRHLQKAIDSNFKVNNLGHSLYQVKLSDNSQLARRFIDQHSRVFAGNML
jgi:SOS response regulatory protein OraA/RecX